MANVNAQKDSFIFNLPQDFVQPDLEKRYNDRFLKVYRKPYMTVLDYLNSTIESINMPSLDFGSVEQTGQYGVKNYYRSSKSPYNVYSREIEVTFGAKDYHINYMILQDVLMTHHKESRGKDNNNKTYLKNFEVIVLDEERRHIYKLVYSGIVITNMSGSELGKYNDKSVDEAKFTISFVYNRLDIEFLLSLGSPEENTEIIEEYSDRLDNNN